MITSDSINEQVTDEANLARIVCALEVVYQRARELDDNFDIEDYEPVTSWRRWFTKRPTRAAAGGGSPYVCEDEIAMSNLTCLRDAAGWIDNFPGLELPTRIEALWPTYIFAMRVCAPSRWSDGGRQVGGANAEARARLQRLNTSVDYAKEVINSLM